MERIHYAGDSVLTGTAIARELLEYARALAVSEDSDTVEIPVRHTDGSAGVANILVGPASQLLSESEETEGDELEDDAVVQDLRHRSARLKPAHPVHSDQAAGDTTDTFDIDDL
ncbi:hypothetical protein ACEXQD_01285 [Herbiconiux sp. P15]|uniref:hypothetical protein n=1 Tax=Herbiconiux liukaitaii TaxID=3342799 RepID=UPI0035B881B9